MCVCILYIHAVHFFFRGYQLEQRPDNIIYIYTNAGLESNKTPIERDKTRIYIYLMYIHIINESINHCYFFIEFIDDYFST